jgi:hypothetical protein
MPKEAHAKRRRDDDRAEEKVEWCEASGVSMAIFGSGQGVRVNTEAGLSFKRPLAVGHG